MGRFGGCVKNFRHDGRDTATGAVWFRTERMSSWALGKKTD